MQLYGNTNMHKFSYSMFFDADNSIFNFKVKNSFLEYFLLETLPVESYARRAYEKFVKKYNRIILNGADESFLNREYFKNFSGMPEKLLLEIGYSWYYKSKLEQRENFFKQKTIFEIEMHKRNNAQIVLLSTSFLPCLEPLMEEISSSAIICPELEILNGYYTGNVIADPLAMLGKTNAIQNFLLKQDNGTAQVEGKSTRIEETDSYFCDIFTGNHTTFLQ